MARQARRNKSFVALAVMVAVGFVAACNAILGNESGVLGDLDGGTDATVLDAAHDGPFVPADAAFDSSPDGEAGLVAPPDATSDGDAEEPTEASPPPDAAIDGNNTPVCTAAQKLCAGTCVALSDPSFGCTATSCDPCVLPHASSTCTAGACAVAQCNAGYGDCDKTAPGCESDLSQPAHCGQCTPACAASAPLCAKVGTTAQCTTGCTADAPTLCSNTCADLQTSPNHCNGCNNICAGADNGQATCTRGRCGISCNPSFHPSADGRSCLSNSLVTSCGPAGRNCTGPASSTPTCDGTSCGFICNSGTHQCPTSGPAGTAFTCASNASVNSCGGRCDACEPPPAHGLASTCDGNNCGFTCMPGFLPCGGVCLDSTSPQSCGACGVSCPGAGAPHVMTVTCTPGAAPNQCGIQCMPGFADCNPTVAGCETATDQSDPANCGGCGVPCGSPNTCAGGVCTAPPPDAGSD